MEGKLAGGRMLVKVKDVVRNAPVVVTVAPINYLQSRRLALPSELVPRATATFARARKVLAEFNNFHCSSINE
jgi:hypothetical protein